ncbi:ABC transporter ATP-binding protein/permease [candidate division KSB1 bacterium]|nr:ABC transporter ATP-binding protein/permease [candidate division KSB1 bacterium]
MSAIPIIQISNVPDQLVPYLTQLNLTKAEINVALQSDLSLEGKMDPSWLLITNNLIFSLIPVASGEKQIIGPFFFKEIQKVRIFTAVGNSFLQVKTENLFINVIRFSNACREEFNRARVYVQEIIDGSAADISIFRKKNPWFCDTCGLALPARDAVCPRCAARGGLVKRTLSMMIPYRGFVFILLLMMLCGVSLDLIPPYLTRILVDDVLTKQSRTEWLIWLVLGLASASFLRAILNIFIGRTSTVIGTRITFELRQQLQKKLSSLSVDFYDRYPVGTLITRLLPDVDYFHGFVQQVAQGFLVNIFLITGIGFMLFRLNVKLAFYVLIPIPFVMLGTWFFWHIIYPRYYRFWDSQSKLATLINGIFSGIRTVKAFAQESREQSRFDAAASYLRDSRRAVDLSATTFFPFFGYIFGLGGFIIWYAGGRSVLEGQITLGTLMAFLSYLGMFYGPISALTMFSNWLTGFLTAGQRIFEILDTDVTIKEPKHTKKLSQVRGKIEFRNVTFGYDPYEPILKDISMLIEPGQMVGIVGKSGSGKTTLINLLCRFYDPQQGQVLIDDVDIRELSNQELRRHVGLVLQEPFLFRATIAENIAYGAPGATPLEIVNAAKSSNSHHFILRQPSGYDTRLGERGAGLSGGEKQRISIARALLCDPKILILDEATSSVDTESELKIQKAIAQLSQGRTAIAVAHRLSTLRNADIIYVIDDGHIVEQGSHAQLMQLGGIYYKLVKIQTEMTKLEA